MKQLHFLKAIVELNTGEGVIIIILNDYHNRLNFTLSVMRARKLGIDVQLVLARDDISEQQVPYIFILTLF